VRFSRAHIPTLKEIPAEAEIISHAFMLRAGMIRKVAAGIYTFLPLGVKVLRKVEKIIREEMERAGAQEVLMSALQPAELWKKSGRWDAYGPEMMRLKDRGGRDFCLGPTHEELITELVKKEVRSYRQLPLNLYQIQVKFRDEIRPRFGVMRGREFIMKDAYSFDRDYGGLQESYRKMHEAYCRIFDRLGLRYYVVEAATGLIGGKVSQEFMVVAKSGEDVIFYCEKCGYAANVELARGIFSYAPSDEKEKEMSEVPTPGYSSVLEVAKFLSVTPEKLVKTIIFKTDGELVAVLVPGDREVNVSKVELFLNSSVEMLPESEFSRYGLVPGFVGPVGLKNVKRVLADEHIKELKNFVVGANKVDAHLINVNLDRDFEASSFGDFVVAKKGDVCPKCEVGELREERGIEVGHIFQLGTKYSEAMEATFSDEDGTRKPFVMGCYGIGVTRLIAAIIEQSHDERGIIWPLTVSPFDYHLILVMPENNVQREIAEDIYTGLLESGSEVLYDEREVTPGVKFADADLIGIPYQIVVGKRAEEGRVEIKIRKSNERLEVSPEEAVSFALLLREKALKELSSR
jgi:prolyl-tRNA synthetase